MNHSYQDALAYYQLEGAHPGGFKLTKDLLKKENIDEQDTILEAGCGLGQTSQYIAETYGCQVHALDLHQEMVKQARKRFQQLALPVTVYMNSMEDMPFSDHYFDFIIAESSTSFTSIAKTIREYYRVLKPGGTLISIDMTAEVTLPEEQRKEIMEFYNLKSILTQPEWISAFNKGGFSQVTILKANTVLAELMNSSASDSKILPLHEDYNQILQEHYRLSLTYGNSLGYRVFRVKK